MGKQSNRRGGRGSSGGGSKSAASEEQLFYEQQQQQPEFSGGYYYQEEGSAPTLLEAFHSLDEEARGVVTLAGTLVIGACLGTWAGLISVSYGTLLLAGAFMFYQYKQPWRSAGY